METIQSVVIEVIPNNATEQDFAKLTDNLNEIADKLLDYEISDLDTLQEQCNALEPEIERFNNTVNPNSDEYEESEIANLIFIINVYRTEFYIDELAEEDFFDPLFDSGNYSQKLFGRSEIKLKHLKRLFTSIYALEGKKHLRHFLSVLEDAGLVNVYDKHIELSVFGIPYELSDLLDWVNAESNFSDFILSDEEEEEDDDYDDQCEGCGGCECDEEEDDDDEEERPVLKNGFFVSVCVEDDQFLIKNSDGEKLPVPAKLAWNIIDQMDALSTTLKFVLGDYIKGQQKQE